MARQVQDIILEVDMFYLCADFGILATSVFGQVLKATYSTNYTSLENGYLSFRK